jgi:hypothetical protein
MSSQAKHYDPTDPKFDPPPHDHYHVVVDVYDGEKHIGRAITHWNVDRSFDGPQGQTFTFSTAYEEPGGKTVHLAIQSEARRQVLD